MWSSSPSKSLPVSSRIPPSISSPYSSSSSWPAISILLFGYGSYLYWMIYGLKLAYSSCFLSSGILISFYLNSFFSSFLRSMLINSPKHVSIDTTLLIISAFDSSVTSTKSPRSSSASLIKLCGRFYSLLALSLSMATLIEFVKLSFAIIWDLASCGLWKFIKLSITRRAEMIWHFWSN